MFSVLSRISRNLSRQSVKHACFPLGSLGTSKTPGKKGGAREITEETAPSWDCHIRMYEEKNSDRMRRNKRNILLEMRLLSHVLYVVNRCLYIPDRAQKTDYHRPKNPFIRAEWSQ